ncbi:MAG TPA: hypothetical protein PK760_16155, partial [Flavobacteriales bacterium]|nr:hypothetical protein [Flavobacteriales bacterium]
MRKLALLLLSIAVVHLSVAQQQLTLKDAVLKAGSDLAPERIRGLQWVKGTDTFSLVKDGALLVGSVGKMADRPVTDLATVNK